MTGKLPSDYTGEASLVNNPEKGVDFVAAEVEKGKITFSKINVLASYGDGAHYKY